MSPGKVDAAIVKALGLDPAKTSMASHGGSGFASTFKISATTEDGEEKLYFVKTGRGEDSKIMFAGEHASLNAIHTVVPTLCPQSYVHGELSSGSGSFLVTDFLNLRASGPAGSGTSLASKLAKLHSTPAPVPEGHDKPQFGFPLPTCCGNTVQENGYMSDWSEFYANHRLRAVMNAIEKKHGRDGELREMVEQTASTAVPRLLGNLNSGKGIAPVVVHGDLWAGNHGSGSIGNGGVEEVVFDPSACYAHSEFEFGIMKMFGGFGGAFEREYFKLKPKDEPREEFGDRVLLYELYHHLNHQALFGSYRSGAVSIMRQLNKKYGT